MHDKFKKHIFIKLQFWSTRNVTVALQADRGYTKNRCYRCFHEDLHKNLFVKHEIISLNTQEVMQYPGATIDKALMTLFKDSSFN